MDIQHPLYFKTAKVATGVVLWLRENDPDSDQYAMTFKGDKWIIFQYSYMLGDPKKNKP